MSNSIRQYCPICMKEVNFNERYPKYVCAECEAMATDGEGHQVYFANTHVMGYGCQGYFKNAKDGNLYNSNYCYIKGFQCIADEARFGGIVIQVV